MRNSPKKILKNYILIFLVNAISMILELVASRILSPYFGVTNDVWTIVIGIILLSSSTGNILGGRFDKIRKSDIMIALAATTMIIPYIADYVLVLSKAATGNLRIGAMISAVILFFIPSMLSGMLTPKLLSENTEKLDEVGKTSGFYYAVMTVGGLFGTFAGGFLLIPVIGSENILKIMGILCIILAFFSAEDLSAFLKTFVVGTALSIAMLTINTEKGNESMIYQTDSEYAHITVWEGVDQDDNRVRFMQTGEQNAYMSATYVDKRKKCQLYSDYLKVMASAIPDKDALNILMCGGGGYGFPKWFLTNPEMWGNKLDVVELDSKIKEVADKYFFLEETVQRYDPKRLRFRNFINDGRIYIEEKEKEYDVIMNDAFAGGGVPARTLTTKEFCEEVYDALTDDGYYIVNVIGALEGRHSMFLQAEYKTLKAVFGNAAVLKVQDVPASQTSNYIVVATKKPHTITEAVDFIPTENAVLLTDDYCPVDTLFVP